MFSYHICCDFPKKVIETVIMKQRREDVQIQMRINYGAWVTPYFKKKKKGERRGIYKISEILMG